MHKEVGVAAAGGERKGHGTKILLRNSLFQRMLKVEVEMKKAIVVIAILAVMTVGAFFLLPDCKHFGSFQTTGGLCIDRGYTPPGQTQSPRENTDPCYSPNPFKPVCHNI